MKDWASFVNQGTQNIKKVIGSLLFQASQDMYFITKRRMIVAYIVKKAASRIIVWKGHFSEVDKLVSVKVVLCVVATVWFLCANHYHTLFPFYQNFVLTNYLSLSGVMGYNKRFKTKKRWRFLGMARLDT